MSNQYIVRARHFDGRVYMTSVESFAFQYSPFPIAKLEADDAAYGARNLRDQEGVKDVQIFAVGEDGAETPVPGYAQALRDLAERTAERDALAATVERLIREASAIRADERKRAEDEHKALDDEGRQRDANRIERLEGELARLRVIVDDADRAKAEHEATRDELRRLHDVLSGKRPLTK